MKENESRDREMEICDDTASRNLGGGNMDVDWNILPKFLKLLNKMLRLKKKTPGTILMVPWLRLHAPKAGSLGLIPGQGTKIPHDTTKTWYSQINLKIYKII